MSATPAVLLVEDELLIAMDLSQRLEELGYDCHVETTIKGALDYLEFGRPAFAFLDHQLWSSVSDDVADRLVALGVPFCVSSASQADELVGTFASRLILPKLYSDKQLGHVLDRLDGSRCMFASN